TWHRGDRRGSLGGDRQERGIGICAGGGAGEEERGSSRKGAKAQRGGAVRRSRCPSLPCRWRQRSGSRAASPKQSDFAPSRLCVSLIFSVGRSVAALRRGRETAWALVG